MSQSNPTAAETADAILETRAAIDVLFEALAHIQASQESSSEAARAESYRNFKQALYTRFQYLKEERYNIGSAPEESPDPPDTGASMEEESTGQSSAAPNAGGSRAADGAEDTLQKFWPAISAAG